MARPQEFDQDTVLKAAMLRFWHDGYAATSLATLLDDTRLTPSSFYNAFGGKKALFVRTLHHYNQRVVDARNRRLQSGEDPIAAIEKFFLSSFEPYRKGEIYGCMLGSTSVEFGDSDAEIRAAVWDGLQRLENALAQRVADARSMHLVPADLDPTKIAAHLLGCFQGLTVIGRLTQDKARLRNLTECALASLGAGLLKQRCA